MQYVKCSLKLSNGVEPSMVLNMNHSPAKQKKTDKNNFISIMHLTVTLHFNGFIVSF